MAGTHPDYVEAERELHLALYGSEDCGRLTHRDCERTACDGRLVFDYGAEGHLCTGDGCEYYDGMK